MRHIMVATFLLASATGALAQAAPAAQQSTDQKIKELEERIIALEGQVRMLKAAQTAPAPAPAAGQAQPSTQVQAAAQAAATPTETTPTVSAPAQAGGAPVGGGTEQAGNLPVYGGASAMSKALNPDISVIGDFIGTAGHNPVFPSPSFEMHESELGLQAIIDPYARGDFFLSFGEEGVDLEEGYITFTALPAGLVLRGGKMRAAFGKVNTLHNHVLPWIDRPLVTNSLVGGEDGINDAGLSLTRIFAGPKQLFLEGTGQVFRGDSDELFQTTNRSDLSVVGHFRGYRDITESTNLDVGASYSRGHSAGTTAVGAATNPFITSLYGADATVRWKPLRRSIYHSFVGRGEFIWSNRQQLPITQRAFGFYLSGDYQLGRRWFVGGRFDNSDRAREAALRDRGFSAVLTYWPSEFSQLRGQYRYTRLAEGINAHELLMQLQFVLGAHGAHPF